MRGLRTALLAAAALLTTTAARADLVRFQAAAPTATCDANCESFTDIGGTGFGNDPRLLTLQDHPFEAGIVTPGAGGVGMVFPATMTGNAADGGVVFNGNNAATTADKAAAPNLQFLGWNTGAKVQIGFVTDNTGNSGITLQSLTLGLYNAGVLIGTFPLANPEQYSQPDLASQPGNGNAVFTYILDAAEQTEFNTLITGISLANLEIGLAGSMGCVVPATGCQASNDGPDSFLALAAPGSPALVPIPGAVWLFGTGMVGLLALGRRRKKAA
jgi:hypothetical protein